MSLGCTGMRGAGPPVDTRGYSGRDAPLPVLHPSAGAGPVAPRWWRWWRLVLFCIYGWVFFCPPRQTGRKPKRRRGESSFCWTNSFFSLTNGTRWSGTWTRRRSSEWGQGGVWDGDTHTHTRHVPVTAPPPPPRKVWVESAGAVGIWGAGSSARPRRGSAHPAQPLSAPPSRRLLSAGPRKRTSIWRGPWSKTKARWPRKKRNVSSSERPSSPTWQRGSFLTFLKRRRETRGEAGEGGGRKKKEKNVWGEKKKKRKNCVFLKKY